MGFIKRFLGLEIKPGEPKPLNKGSFDEEVLTGEIPSFVYFFHLWCSSCQVMGGLLNEVGPDYADRAEFFKMNVHKEPAIPARYKVAGVPTLIVFKKGEEADRLVGMHPLDPLREWIEKHLQQ
jgi:thioredoxin 1